VNLPLGYNAQTSEISSGICMTRLKLRISSVSKFGHADLCPPYEPLSVYGSGPPPNVWFPEPTRVHTPRSTSIGSAVLQGSHARFPEDTHRQTTLNYNSRPHLMLCIAMRRSKPRNLQTDGITPAFWRTTGIDYLLYTAETSLSKGTLQQ